MSIAGTPPSLHKPVPKLPPRAIQDLIPRLGWCWETGAVFVSLACMSLIVAILFAMDGKPLRLWALPIQPNSLVAVFSTITKSALLIPLAESIGQLKWGYFNRPRSISHMQTFDEASRGPWGAFVFLWKTRGTSYLASFGSFITVLMLGFEPFTQQIIELYTQESALLNRTGFVTATRSFAFWDDDAKQAFPGEFDYRLTSGMLGAITGQPMLVPNSTYCPTLDCRVEDFTSIAVCPYCETEEVEFSQDSKHCYYDVQKGLTRSLNVTETEILYDYGPTGLLSNESIHGPLTTFSDFRAVAAEVEEGSVWVRECAMEFADYGAFNLIFRSIPQALPGSEPAWAHIMSLDYWGEQQSIGIPHLGWNASAAEVKIRTAPYWDSEQDRISACITNPDLVATEDPQDTLSDWSTYVMSISNYTCFTTTSDLRVMEQPDHFGEVGGTITRCRPSFCARHHHNVSIGIDGMKADQTTDSPLIPHHIYQGEDPDTDIDLFEAMDEFNNTFHLYDVSSDLLKAYFTTVMDSENFRFILDLNMPRSGENWARLIDRVSNVFTQATVYGPEIFVRVRWVWFIMPLFLVLASNIFLCLTIYHSRKSRFLYKNSVMAILFHGLEGWEAYELLPAKTPGRETYHDIMDTSERMRASLRRNSEGVLKLKRE